MPRSPLTESVRKVQELLLKIKTTLTDDEFNLLLDELVPEPAPQSKSTRRTTKKPESKPRKGQCGVVGCDFFKVDPIHNDPAVAGYHVYQSTKSVRASGMAAVLNRSLAQQRQSIMLCTHVSEDGDDPTQCGEAEGNGIHDPSMGYRNYHPFTPSAPVATAAGRSSRQSSTDGSGVGLETPLGEDGVAVHGAGGGG